MYQKENKKKIRIFRAIVCMTLVISIIFTPVADGLFGSIVAQAVSDTKAKKAFSAYLKTGKWGYSNMKFNPSSISFYYTRVGKNKTPLLIAKNSAASHADGYVAIYQYINGKVFCVGALDWVDQLYKDSGVIALGHMGGGYGEEDLIYYKMNANGKFKKCASSSILGKEWESFRKMFGPDKYMIDSKHVSKAKFNKYMKKIKNGSKNTVSKIKFKKNTSANRKKYLG